MYFCNSGLLNQPPKVSLIPSVYKSQMLQLNLDFFRIRFFLEELKKPFEFDSGLQSFYRDHIVDSSGQKIEKKDFWFFPLFYQFSSQFALRWRVHSTIMDKNRDKNYTHNTLQHFQCWKLKSNKNLGIQYWYMVERGKGKENYDKYTFFLFSKLIFVPDSITWFLLCQG